MCLSISCQLFVSIRGHEKKIASFPTNFDGFFKSVCCDVTNEKCMSNECKDCDLDITYALVPLSCMSALDDTVKWKHWRVIDNRMILSYSEESTKELISEIESQLPAFKLHSFIKRTQQNHFESTKTNLLPGEVVLQIDFAENYRLTSQNEVQSAHFSYTQVTLFTCVAWLHKEVKSFAIVSDKLTHNKYDVYCFFSNIINKLKRTHVISKIFVFSDGCSSQFKNKFILRTIPHFVECFQITFFQWNFFATSHGKGAVDGIGAVVKRKVWEIVRTQSIVLSNAYEFYDCAKKNISGIDIIFLSSTEIDNLFELTNNLWLNIRNIPGVKSFHSFQCSNKNYIKAARTAKSKYSEV